MGSTAVKLHELKCSLCRSPERERWDAQLADGDDPALVRRRFNATLAPGAPKLSRLTLDRHQRLNAPESSPASAREESGPTDAELLDTPVGELSRRTLHLLLGAGVQAVIANLRRKLTHPLDKSGLFELTDTLQKIVNVTVQLSDFAAKAGVTDVPGTAAAPTIEEIIERISDPGDRAAFIETQRSLNGTMREAIKLVRKYESNGHPAAEEEKTA